MVTSQWPRLRAYDYDSIEQEAIALRSHCRAIVQHTLEYPIDKATSHYIRELAASANSVVTRFIDHILNDSHEVGAEEAEEFADVQDAGQEADDYEASSATAGARLIEQWVGDVQTVPDLDDPMADSLPLPRDPTRRATEPTALDHRIKIRWDCVDAPYAKANLHGLLIEIQGIIRQSQDPLIEDVAIAAVERRGFGDLDIHVDNVDDRKALISNSQSWLPRVRNGSEARIMEDKYSIVTHSVPKAFLPTDRPIEEAKQQIIHDNRHLIPNAEILHLGWLSGPPVSNQKNSSVVISFKDPWDANVLIRRKLSLRGHTLRTERYKPACNVVQCTKCLAFGHTVLACRASVCCPFCLEAHDRSLCEFRTLSGAHRCLNCRGRHAAFHPACLERARLESMVKTAQLNMPHIFVDSRPVPATLLATTSGTLGDIVDVPTDVWAEGQLVKGEEASVGGYADIGVRKRDSTTMNIVSTGIALVPEGYEQRPAKRPRTNGYKSRGKRRGGRGR